MDEGRDRRPAGGRHVQHVGLRRRHRCRARDPVERLVEGRSLDEVQCGRNAGLLDAFVEDLCQPLEKGRPAAPRPEDPTHPGGMQAAPDEAVDHGGGIAAPAEQPADESGRQLAADAALGSAKATPGWQGLGPDLDAPDLLHVGRQLEQARPAVGRDDRKDLPIELGEALHEQVAPGADAADDVGIRTLGREQHTRPVALRLGAQGHAIRPCHVHFHGHCHCLVRGHCRCSSAGPAAGRGRPAGS